MEWMLEIATILGGIAAIYYFWEKFRSHRRKYRLEEDIVQSELDDLKYELNCFILSIRSEISNCPQCSQHSDSIGELQALIRRIRSISGFKKIKKELTNLSEDISECQSCSEIAVELYEYEHKIEEITSNLVQNK